MFQVIPERIDALQSFFPASLPNAPMLQAYFQGRAPGRAFVEAQRAPKACIVAMNYRFVFLGGDVKSTFLKEAIVRLRREQTLHIVWTKPHGMPRDVPSPDEEIERLEFARRDDPQGERLCRQRHAIPGTKIKRIDATLFRRCQWRDEVKGAVGSAREFLENGIGFCLMAGDRIAAEAYACLWGRDRCEIATVTHADFRGRGFATTVCAQLISACEAMGIQPYWGCDAGNDASLRVADKLGFVDPRPYRLMRYDCSVT